MSRKFESHLTCHIKDAIIVEDMVNTYNQVGTTPMKFSKIEGDAIMGAKPWCYVTMYDTNAKLLLMKNETIRDGLKDLGVETLRIKIEEIIYDTKTGVNNL